MAADNAKNKYFQALTKFSDRTTAELKSKLFNLSSRMRTRATALAA